MAKPKAFNTYLDNQNKLETLSDQQAGRLYKALCAYAATGTKPDFSDDPVLQYAFLDFSGQIDRDFEKYDDTVERRKEAAKTAANARWSKEEKCDSCETHNENAKRIQTHANASKKCDSCQEEKEEEKDNKEKESIKKEKVRCGTFDNVQLTEAEIEKLKAQFSDYQERIDRLSEYIASTGKKYKSHYAVILTWARKDKKERPPNKRGSMYSADGASFDVSKYENSSLFND